MDNNENNKPINLETQEKEKNELHALYILYIPNYI